MAVPSVVFENVSRRFGRTVALLRAVSARPELLLLDDPTAGLDPLARREVLDGVLKAVSHEGGAVVYASHLVHDVERVADRVVVLDGGAIRLEGDLDALKARIRRARAVFDGEAPRGVAIAGAIDTVQDGRVLSVIADSDDGELGPALRALGAREVEIEPLPLEEILVALLREGRTKGAVHV